MSTYLSFAIEHSPLDLSDKEKCFAYCEALYGRFVDVYSNFGEVTYYIDEEYYDHDQCIEFTVLCNDDIIAIVDVLPDFFFIDPFYDDWELVRTPYVGETAREMIQIFDPEIKELWYINDGLNMDGITHNSTDFKDFINTMTAKVGGHIPVINTEEHTIDGVPYIPDEMCNYRWIAFCERFE